jgi:hypothetical protein
MSPASRWIGRDFLNRAKPIAWAGSHVSLQGIKPGDRLHAITGQIELGKLAGKNESVFEN